MKAFVVTRVGDVFLAFALFILYNELGHPELPRNGRTGACAL
ncbi:NADH-quinone oxidoreductase subunit L [Raoultella planticola]|uniref:NADH-quinone oxidoreductase subunit L n=1 Tax=Raoultella planticola TaxID=575 RepID=A0A485C4W1_RAOPL|nr:NADH-quinone oxidoreductase subunit L [Raoultella planticola]